MNTLRFPSMLAPRYHELHVGKRVKSATSATKVTHASCASAVGSISRTPRVRRCSMHPVIQSTCCSTARPCSASTDGLPGPVDGEQVGKFPATPSPRIRAWALRPGIGQRACRHDHGCRSARARPSWRRSRWRRRCSRGRTHARVVRRPAAVTLGDGCSGDIDQSRRCRGCDRWRSSRSTPESLAADRRRRQSRPATSGSSTIVRILLRTNGSRELVGRGIDQQVVERPHEAQAAALPAFPRTGARALVTGETARQRHR